MTKKELASVLKVSTRTIERAKLPCLLVGSQNRYQLSKVEKALRKAMPVAPDRIEVVLTLTHDEYRELVRSLKKIRDQLNRPDTSNTQLILDSAAHFAEHGMADEADVK